MCARSAIDGFDTRAENYDDGWRGEFHRRVVAAAATLVVELAPAPNAVLDIGCGTGLLLASLADALPGAALAGVDPAKHMIEIARARSSDDPRITLHEASASSLPFADETFDLATSTVSFHHWDDQAQGLREVARVLRPGAMFLLADHFADGWLRAFNALARRNMRSARDVKRMLAAAGFASLPTRRVFDLGPLPLIRGLPAVRE